MASIKHRKRHATSHRGNHHQHRRHSRQSQHTLYQDLAKIGSAFAKASQDVQSKTRDALYDSVENVKSKSVDVKDGIAHYAAEKPFKSLSLAMLTGLVIGYMMHRH